jgi:hypothetical protein
MDHHGIHHTEESTRSANPQGEGKDHCECEVQVLPGQADSKEQILQEIA